ncbi:Glycosyltransferase family 4 protein OS=Streptomyces tendae OX=1932 GN=GUR47_11810 PE=4 SV=1 [Streptomyces tendae]
MVQLPPGVDEKTFHPASGGDEVRARLGLTERPVVVCVSRLVPRKGQDTLIRAMPRILAAEPDAVLLIVGGGPSRRTCAGSPSRRASPPPSTSPAPCPGPNCPRTTAPGTSSPCPAAPAGAASTSRAWASSTWRCLRDRPARRRGRLGGAPDAVLDGETGWVVRGEDPDESADRITTLLADPQLRRRMGERGRTWVEEKWRWTCWPST